MNPSTRVVRNSLWNLAGQASPMFVGVLTIPILIRWLGTDRFGILAIAWTFIGYFSLFDFGVGRALTQLLAGRLGAGKEQESGPLVWTSLLLMFGFGVIGAVLIGSLAERIVLRWLNVPTALQPETLLAFQLLAIFTPVVIVAAGFRAILEAQQHFQLASYLRAALGIFTFAGPLIAMPFTKNLAIVVGILGAGRVLALVANVVICLWTLPALRSGLGVQFSYVRPLLGFGVWQTASSVVGPLMLTLDRFWIAAAFDPTAVSYYATSFEVVSKTLIVSGAISGVLFPAFATHMHDRALTAVLFRRGLVYIFAVLFPVILAIVLFAPEALSLWLGPEFAEKSYRVAQLLGFGVFFFSFESIPYVLLQAFGRPDIPSKINLVEIPFYYFFLWLAIRHFGIVGAPAMWVARATIDALALFFFAGRIAPGVLAGCGRVGTIALIGVVVLAAAGLTPMGALAKSIAALLAVLGSAGALWWLVLARDERIALRRSFAFPGTAER